MTQFYIVEILQYPNGEYGHNVHYAFDEDPDIARLKGESKYHEVLSSAAVSDTLSHSAIMFNTDAFPLIHQDYKHKIQAVPAEAVEESIGEGA